MSISIEVRKGTLLVDAIKDVNSMSVIKSFIKRNVGASRVALISFNGCFHFGNKDLSNELSGARIIKFVKSLLSKDLSELDRF